MTEQEINKEPTINKLPPEEADLEERIKGFNTELPILLGKYELGLGAMAKINPDGRIAADPVVLSARNHHKQEKPSGVTGPKPDSALVNPDA